MLTFGYDPVTGVGVHRDGAWLDKDLGLLLPPMLTLKAAIWLSDVRIGDGNLRVFPGTHILDTATLKTLNPTKIKFHEVEARAGDATFFDRRIFHTRTWNRSVNRRLMVFIEFSVTWLRRKQNFYVSDMMKDNMHEKIVEELLMEPVNPWSYYWP